MKLDDIITFIKVSPVQQFCAFGIMAPIITDSLYNAIENLSQGKTSIGMINITETLFYTGLFLVNQYQAGHNMEEYNDVKKVLDKRGWDERIIERKSHSWCQRNMVQVASSDAGFGKETRDYLHEKGYRRYNTFKF